MQEFIPALVTFLSAAVIVVHIALVAGLLSYLLLNKNPLRYFSPSFEKNLIPVAFFVTLGMSALALFFEYAGGFEPCMLCWWQRIFMFPQVILLGIAWFRRDSNIVLYSLALSVIGLLVGMYNYSLLFVPSLAPCVAAGVSCTKIYFLEFGYITFPMWGITGFLLLIALMLAEKYKRAV